MKGMKKKPLIIVLFSLLYFLNPFANLFLIFLSNTNKSWVEHIVSIGNLISQGNIVAIATVLLWISAIPLAYGLFKVRAWAWYYFIIYFFAILIVSLLKTNEHNIISFGFSKVFFANIIFMIPIGFFIQKEIRAPYLNPSLRWWEQAIRVNHTLTVQILNNEFITYDISSTGAFVIANLEKLQVKVGDVVPIFIFFDDATVKCYSEIIWTNYAKEAGYVPEGVGVRFLKLDRSDKIIIQTYVNNLIKEGVIKART